MKHLEWDCKGGFWYGPHGREVTPQEMKAYAQQLLAACKFARPYIAKMCADKVETVVPPSLVLKRINQAIEAAEAR